MAKTHIGTKKHAQPEPVQTKKGKFNRSQPNKRPPVARPGEYILYLAASAAGNNWTVVKAVNAVSRRAAMRMFDLGAYVRGRFAVRHESDKMDVIAA